MKEQVILSPRTHKNAPRPQKRPWWPTVASAALLLLAAGALVIVLYYQQQSVPVIGDADVEIIEVTPEDSAIIAISERREPARVSMKVRAGDRIEARQGQVRLKFANESTTLRITSESIVKVDLLNGAKRIMLDRGEMTAEVAMQPEGKPLRIITAFSTTEVAEAKLDVCVDKAESRLEVAEGVVNLLNTNGQAVSVKAGEGQAVRGNKFGAYVPGAQRTIAFWDFEAIPDEKHFDGQQVIRPDGSVSRNSSCIQSIVYKDKNYRDDIHQAVTWHDADPLIISLGNEVVEFDYYLPSATQSATIVLNDEWYSAINATTSGRWLHAKVAVNSLQGNYRQYSMMDSNPASFGGALTSLTIRCPAGNSLLVDNLKITRIEPSVFPVTSTTPK